MPDKPNYGKRAHPLQRLPRGTDRSETHCRAKYRPYAELRCRSNFSFLRGASHPEELVERAAELGYAALAITDRHTLAGVVRMHCAAKVLGLKLIVGAEIVPPDAAPLLLYAADRASYARLSRLITRGRLRCKKGDCEITFEDIADGSDGLLAAVCLPPRSNLPEEDRSSTKPAGAASDRWSIGPLLRYREVFGDRLYLAAAVHGGPDDRRDLAALAALSRKTSVPLLAGNDVHYHQPQRRFLHDVLTCVREHCTLAEAGERLFPNAERYLKPVEQMARLFAEYPEALERTVELAGRCHFRLDELRYEYPEALCPADTTPADFLARLAWSGAEERYPDGVPGKVRRQIEHELALIRRLAYEPYFLTVWDIVAFARSRGILCQGRGSAANSAVCYCLGITSVDPERIEVLFERFVSAERNEPPDIDVDFEHERREEVFQYLYDKYGRDHAGIVAEVITYRPRSAIRDVGKALGLSLDRVGVLAKRQEWWSSETLDEAMLREAGFDAADRTVQMLRRLVRQLIGFPRHLSQHVGGFVITRGPLSELVPIENAAIPDRTFIEWDKDDVDALGILKIDCLALGMLTAIRKCFALIRDRRAEEAREQGNEGTRERGNEGTRDRGIKRSRDEGKEKSSERRIDSVAEVDWNERTHRRENVSRSDCVAEGHCADPAGVRGQQDDAVLRKVRADRPDAPLGRFDSQQHRRGECPPVDARLPSLSHDGQRFARGAGNTGHHRPRASDAGRNGEHPERHPRGPTHSSRPDYQPPQETSAAEPAFPQGLSEDRHPLVPVDSTDVKDREAPSLSCSIGPDSLDPSIPQSLTPSVPSSLTDVPAEDPVVYDMVCRADTIGVFQIESRAQMSMLPRLKPRCYYDLVIEVAIVRPGPIQGGMVHPYLRRRCGQEPITYPNPAIQEVLCRTLGVPLFQEQAMKLAVVAAGFTPGEADQLRRAMGAWRRNGDITRFQTKLIEGMRANGLCEEFAQRCFEQISGFGEYGFPESHAASFALLVYVSAWLKRYHPAAFCAAVMNSQPMGFYEPAQLVRDARDHGIDVRPVDVNSSGYDCGLERGGDGEQGLRDQGIKGSRDEGTPDAPRRGQAPGRRDKGKGLREQGIKGTRERHAAALRKRDDPSTWGIGGPAVRLGMRLVRGVSATQVEGIERAQRDGPFASVADLARRSSAPRATLARLAAADAMRSLGLPRREALWQVLALGEDSPLLAGAEPDEPPPGLPVPSMKDTVWADYEHTGLSLTAHPVSLVRRELQQLRAHPVRALCHARQGQRMRVAGLVLVRQRPSTALGIIFCTLEDETGIANLIIRPEVYARHRLAARSAIALIAEGRVDRQGEVVHLNASRLQDLSCALRALRSPSRDFH